MIRISNLMLPVEHGEGELEQLAAKRLGCGKISSLRIVKRSVDARKKQDLKFVYTVEVEVPDEKRYHSRPGVSMERETVYTPPCTALKGRPVIAGFGPAGMFAALTLAKAGARPIVLERGKCVEERKQDVTRFWAGGALVQDSNVQFGEGGAGTFSDGKLTTGTKSPYAFYILREMVRFGAPEEIVWLNKPHIGTDRLEQMVRRLREEVIRLGGEVRFQSTLNGLITDGGKLVGVRYCLDGELRELKTNRLILAIGHSARDTFRMLWEEKILLEPKPFSVGVRIEHLQREIDRAQFGGSVPQIGPADYKLSAHLPNGRGVYTFCMCPGGRVVAAASGQGGVVTNGMSDYARDGENANSALLVGVNPTGDAFAGVRLQEQLEQAAFRVGGGDYRAPAQLVGDFLLRRPSRDLGEVQPTYQPGVVLCSLDECLPGDISDSLRCGLTELGKRLKGFDRYDSVLTGVETRSSSPVRILRDEQHQSVSCKGLYPCGEGAGYAGGIMSAAADGVRLADAILREECTK